jgi:hypothetical protein
VQLADPPPSSPKVAGKKGLVYFRPMSTILEIESAISRLPKQEFWQLSEWFDRVKERTWDEQMEADSEAGKLDFLFEEAENARLTGNTKPWPAGA